MMHSKYELFLVDEAKRMQYKYNWNNCCGNAFYNTLG